MNERRIIIIITTIIFVIIFTVIGVIVYNHTNARNNNINNVNDIPKSEAIDLVPTMESNFTLDSAWVGTFELIWQDLKNEVIKQDIVFVDDTENTMVKDLNKELFKINNISDSKYYKTYGFSTPSLKEEIIKNINEKFNQESDILDGFNFAEGSTDYFFYTMLYNKFEYEEEFVDYKTDTFKDEEALFYGTKDAYKYVDMIDVLYYNSVDDFAILIKTKGNDEIIYVKDPKGTTFSEIYNNILKEESNYQGDKKFNKNDTFKAPYLSINITRDYTELENKLFYDINNKGYYIEKAIQTLKLRMDEKGGEIKSEAGIGVKTAALDEAGRDFILNDTFALFIRENNRTLPYAAVRVDNISKFQ